MKNREVTWNKEYNLIFVDSPVGTGKRDRPTTAKLKVGLLYSFLRSLALLLTTTTTTTTTRLLHYY